MPPDKVVKLLKGEPFVSFVLHLGVEDVTINDPQTCRVDSNAKLLFQKTGPDSTEIIDLRHVRRITVGRAFF